ncbi:MAG: DUF3750 domain-containing protein [Deltaproteobacteria bacterium]|nr:DUF3750 domain-containing protein [Deltaproteobacteria bacterium]
MLKELRGSLFKSLIDEVQKAVRNSPWQYPDCVFPEPNSNLFTAWIASRSHNRLFLPVHYNNSACSFQTWPCRSRQKPLPLAS